MMTHHSMTKICEVSGSFLGIVYALLVASNTGREILGFVLLFVSAGFFGAWAIMDKRWAFLTLQFFYLSSAIMGIIRWS